MATISISKKEYHQLVEKALRYEYISQLLKEDIFASPPTRSVKKIIESFKATRLYNKEFLRSLKEGLKRSLYFRT